MPAIYQTPVDFLYFALTICISVITLFLVISLLYWIGVLKNIKVITAKAKDSVELINHYLWQPIKIVSMIIERTKAFAGHKKDKKESRED